MSEQLLTAGPAGETAPTAVTAEQPWMDQILLCTHPWVQCLGAAGKPRVSNRQDCLEGALGMNLCIL